MDDFVYKVGDGSEMNDIDDFLSYVSYLKVSNQSFDFQTWFCKDDFNSIEVFLKLKNYIKSVEGNAMGFRCGELK